MINYGFRQMTNDIDAVFQAGSAMKEAADTVAEEYNLPANWLNSDFTFTNSYTDKLVYFSEPYKTFSNILHVRTISGEYLIAMKLMSGRIYKNDLSDILGVLTAQREKGKEISLPQIIKAVEDLYGEWRNIPERSRKFIEFVYEDNNLNDLYQYYREKELNAGKLLDSFDQKYPELLTIDNVNDVIESLQQKLSEN